MGADCASGGRNDERTPRRSAVALTETGPVGGSGPAGCVRRRSSRRDVRLRSDTRYRERDDSAPVATTASKRMGAAHFNRGDRPDGSDPFTVD